MSSPALEAFLARIYTDGHVREKFLADPRGEALRAGLSESEVTAMERIDRAGLELTVRSLNHKRQRRSRAGDEPS